ncbi:uncharacterized protein LOC128390995 [Panonychus citri]|uniref:uncharacterized protein LOC128390995 n=1 Tax=Panonychus citri TaxID=50023 RepID=UPI00230820E4|nr:uncharacterized protein LOC128390995 [Panonychus citri]
MFNDGDNFQPSSVNINNNSDVVPPPRPPPPPEHQQQSNHFRPRLHIFNGHDKSVTIENWLKLYESTANRYNWSYDEKIDLLAEYLDKDALNTYISARDSGDWITIKNKLITRFGVRSIRPSVEFCRLKFNHVKNVDEYFESKKRLAGLAGFTETQAVELMIDHLSDELNRCFLGHQVNTYCEFYTIAKTAEQQLPRNDNHNNNNNQNKNQTTERSLLSLHC